MIVFSSPANGPRGEDASILPPGLGEMVLVADTVYLPGPTCCHRTLLISSASGSSWVCQGLWSWRGWRGGGAASISGMESLSSSCAGEALRGSLSSSIYEPSVSKAFLPEMCVWCDGQPCGRNLLSRPERTISVKSEPQSGHVRPLTSLYHSSWHSWQNIISRRLGVGAPEAVEVAEVAAGCDLAFDCSMMAAMCYRGCIHKDGGICAV